MTQQTSFDQRALETLSNLYKDAYWDRGKKLDKRCDDALTELKELVAELVIDPTHKIYLTKEDVAQHGDKAGADVARHWDTLRAEQRKIIGLGRKE